MLGAARGDPSAQRFGQRKLVAIAQHDDLAPYRNVNIVVEDVVSRSEHSVTCQGAI
jgi:hypothetical protein